MGFDAQKIAELEQIIPRSLKAMSGSIPGMDVTLRDDLVLICSQSYPDPDINRAFLLRTTPEKADALIDEITEKYRANGMPVNILISPACTPADLPERLLKRGFVKQEPDECWLVYENLQAAKVPNTDPNIIVKPVIKQDVEIFAQVMTSAFGMSQEWVGMLAQVLEPTIGLPNLTHYLAYRNETPLATLTLMRDKDLVVIGSGGVVPEHRGSSLIFNLAVKALIQAQAEGVQTIVGQTTVGPLLERYLRIYGFKTAFKRSCYMLA